MLELLKVLVLKISEFYDQVFKSRTRFIIIFVAYFILMAVLPKSTANIIGFSFLAFIILGFAGRILRKKSPPKS